MVLAMRRPKLWPQVSKVTGVHMGGNVTVLLDLGLLCLVRCYTWIDWQKTKPCAECH